jgi:hypothetical protein
MERGLSTCLAFLGDTNRHLGTSVEAEFFEHLHAWHLACQFSALDGRLVRRHDRRSQRLGGRRRRKQLCGCALSQVPQGQFRALAVTRPSWSDAAHLKITHEKAAANLTVGNGFLILSNRLGSEPRVKLSRVLAWKIYPLF